MKARYFTSEDYLMVSEWWKSWKWPPIPQVFLPKIGIIVSNDGDDVCAAWIYRTDSKLCMFEFFISSPDVGREKRKGTIEFLLSEMEVEAKTHGYMAAFMSVHNQSLIKKAKEVGFTGEETGMTNLTRVF